VFGATHPEEITFPAFERVLEEGEEDSASNSGKAHPETFSLLFHLKNEGKRLLRVGCPGTHTGSGKP